MSLDHIVGNNAKGWEWRGHTVRLLDLAALARFERKVFSNYRAALHDLREMYGDDAWERALAEMQSNKASGAFGLKGRIGLPWAATPEGLSFLVELILDYDGHRGLSGWSVFLEAPEEGT